MDKAEYHRLYYLKNKEKIKEQQRIRYEENTEKYLQSSKKYYENNKKKLLLKRMEFIIRSIINYINMNSNNIFVINIENERKKNIKNAG
jgi:hypothetical protein